MERALELGHLSLALGEVERALLPSPAELQSVMAEAEVALFTQQPAVSPELLTAGWYLHGIASAEAAADLYPWDRQRRAFQISAHIFDLALSSSGDDLLETLRLAFGAQIGYRRGELDPNAGAIYHRVTPLTGLLRDPNVALQSLALKAGVGMLGFDPAPLREWLTEANAYLRVLKQRLAVDDLNETGFGTSAEVVWGVRRLLQFLTTGGIGNLDSARDHFDRAIENGNAGTGLDPKWVAVHLRRLSDDLAVGSIWTAFPPEIPAAARQALTLSVPPVLTLWPPQRELIAREPSPLSPEARRLVMSVPTSAGKTLMAQLLVVSHLASQEKSVCYVAPMRSLGRELRRALAVRLRHLDRDIGPELPDFITEFGLLASLVQEEPDVDVITPERLLNMLRHEASQVLDRYGLFIFDEAQLLGEDGRGFVLEQVLTFLQWKTRNSDHRLILLSAALGNRGQLVQWLGAGNTGAELFESQWRGPRRLHALYTTRPEWDEPIKTEPVASDQRPWRTLYPLIGTIRLRPAAGQTQRLRLQDPVGEIAIRRDDPAEHGGKKEAGKSTTFRAAVARLASAVGEAGPALVVTSTRDGAKRMAEDIASLREQQAGSQRLKDLVVRTLGPEHPLGAVIGSGVAFHHAGLPREILDALEEGFREGSLGYLTCTTTLTEGVNLPARTVVVAETPTGSDYEPVLLGARLVNAIGRAGRAGKESEGWIVLALSNREKPNDFEQLEPADDELTVESRLIADDALEALAKYEEALSEGEDAIFSEAAVELGGFLSFVWFLLASEELSGISPTQAALEEALNASLGFTQAGTEVATRWLSVAENVRASYVATATEARLRYSRRGTQISTAAQLDQIVESAWPSVLAEESRDDPDVALEIMRETGVVRQLLDLHEASSWLFKRARTGSVQPIAVDPDALLKAWIDGESPTSISDDFLSEVPRRDWASEQIVDALTTHFESYLSWMLGSVVESFNERLIDGDVEPLFCPSFPAFTRYGVKSSIAVVLLSSGIRSRRLANAIAHEMGGQPEDVAEIREWIGAMSMPEWRDRFDATAGDILDLLDYARQAGTKPLVELLEHGEVILDAVVPIEMPGSVEVSVHPIRDDVPPQRYGVFQEETGELLTTVVAPLHNDVEALIQTALIERIDLVDGHGLNFRAEMT